MSFDEEPSLPPKLLADLAAMKSGMLGEEGRVLDERPICGAKSKRSGKPCQCKILGRGGRCYMHGGASTGPKTEQGRVRALMNLIPGRIAKVDGNSNDPTETRLIKAPPSAQPPPPTATPSVHVCTGEWPLEHELETLRRSIPPEQYAYATARDFAPGGRYNRNRKPRYALT